jgi:hypothetical protein
MLEPTPRNIWIAFLVSLLIGAGGIYLHVHYLKWLVRSMLP